MSTLPSIKVKQGQKNIKGLSYGNHNYEKKIAIQGYAGSFHEIAARQVFGEDIEIVPCKTFRELFKITEHDSSICGAVAAIENSIAGSILPNYRLLQESHLLVTGEIYLPVCQNLLVLPGVKLEDLKEVYSHPMALLQCADFLDRFQFKLVESEDTALSAKIISERRMERAAAIASDLAAKLYGLEVLKADIQTEKANYTRFLKLELRASLTKKIDHDKASVFFELDHKEGSLARVLYKFANCGINLSKLQSVAIPQSPWQYSFHADMEFRSLDDFNKAIDQIMECTTKVFIYGVYHRGEIQFSNEIVNHEQSTN